MCDILGSHFFQLDFNGKNVSEQLSQKMCRNRKRPHYILGQNYVTQDIDEALSKRLERDYPQILDENCHHFKAIFVPETFIPKAPKVIDRMDPEPTENKIIGDLRKFKGDVFERKCYNILRNIFDHRKENVLVINQLEINLTDENSRKLEIDFIVVNQTKKYLWNIECKTWLGDVHDKPKSFLRAIDQLTKNKKNLEKWFGADLKSQWKYFTSIFCAKMELSDHKCSNGCKRFIATTEHDLCQILKNFEAENLQDSPDFSRKDFIILRYLYKILNS